MQILGRLGMYFDAVVVEVQTFLLIFRLALTILCAIIAKNIFPLLFFTRGVPNLPHTQQWGLEI